ncbi:hypothetical protein [Nocardiopsis chromatogenes]|uniref:hypothetical protein n=1 Tax=Nocardiopsis chromatogenes TaxID=280239 RepID=UPI000346EAC1|nr:hypothetical protein [Nocardiopsis chromatogenes]
MTWHLTPRQLEAYARGSADDVAVMSAEAHLVHCPACRSALPADEAWLAASWTDLRDLVDRPRRGPLERLLSAVGVSEDKARLLAATPRLYRAWLAATVAVLVCALFAAHTVRGGALLFLYLAPVLPLAGVALAYGRRVDPAHAFTSTTPMGGQRLLFLRSLAVLVPAVALCAGAALLLPSFGPAWAPASWLLPSLTLVAASLALTRWIPLSASSALLAGGWMAALAGAELVRTWNTVHLFGPPAQLFWAVALAALLAAHPLLRTVRA